MCRCVAVPNEVCVSIFPRGSTVAVRASGPVAAQNEVRHWCVFRKVFRVCVLRVSMHSEPGR